MKLLHRPKAYLTLAMPPQPKTHQALTVGRFNLASQPVLNAELTLRAIFHLVDEIGINISLLAIGKSESIDGGEKSSSAGSSINAEDANTKPFNITSSSAVLMAASAILDVVQAKKRDLLGKMGQLV